jgi:AraC family transcriptional activator of pyochelin receptor
VGERLTLLNGALVVSAGVNKFDAPMHVDTALRPGMKVVVLLSGRMQIRIGNDIAREICGPASVVIKSPHAIPRDQVYSPEIPVRYALVQMDDDLCGQELSAMLGMLRAKAGSSGGDGAILLTSSADSMQQSLARQLMNCPFVGPERNLYLGGKALQLAALTVAQCVSEADAAQTRALSSRDVERIREARDVLIAAMREPPSLATLARRVGLNVRKLNTGFRQVFGTTVFGFLQEYRLETAYKLLAAGEMSVAEAAYHVGYRPTHFTTIFRKRFGVSPSQLA